MAKKGLGRGLDALFPVMAGTVEWGNVEEIPLDLITPNPYQPRDEFDEEALKELAGSIKEHGVIQPVLLRPSTKETYQLIAGERRWRACCLLQMATIPALIRELNDQEALEIALIENLQRRDLEPLEEARAYDTLLKGLGRTQEEIAAGVGKSRSHVANTLRLLQLPSEIRLFLDTRQITAGHARALLGLPEEKALAIARVVVQRGLNVRQTEFLAQAQKEANEAELEKGRVPEPYPTDLEEKLQSRLGTRVRIKQGRDRGWIRIDYHSDEELSRLLELLL